MEHLPYAIVYHDTHGNAVVIARFMYYADAYEYKQIANNELITIRRVLENGTLVPTGPY